MGTAMLKDLFNFKKTRTPVEAAAFFGFYTAAFLLVTTLLGL